MPTANRSTGPPQPPLVSILRQGGYLIASIHTALDDTQLQRFQRDLIDQVGRDRARGIIIDVAALDVLDSFATHTLSTLANIAKLRGRDDRDRRHQSRRRLHHGATRHPPGRRARPPSTSTRDSPCSPPSPIGRSGTPALSAVGTRPMTSDAVDRLGRDYRPAFLSFLAHPDEETSRGLRPRPRGAGRRRHPARPRPHPPRRDR